MKDKKFQYNLNDRDDIKELLKELKVRKKIEEQEEKITVYDTDAKHLYVAKCLNCLSLFFIDNTIKYCPICGDEDITILGETQPKIKYKAKIYNRGKEENNE